VNTASESYDTVDDEICEFEAIQAIMRRCQKHSYAIAAGVEGDIVPILNITKSSTSDLRALLSLFVSDIPESATRNEIVTQLSDFIPKATVQDPPTKCAGDGKICAGCLGKFHWYQKYSKKISACSWCARQFCKNCPLLVCHFPRIGLASCQLCTECIDSIKREDANDWQEASVSFLTKSDEQSIMAALGCAFVAMALGVDSQELLRKMAKELHHQQMHTLAYSLLFLALSQSEESGNKSKLKLHLLASSILKNLAVSCGKRNGPFLWPPSKIKFDGQH